MHVMARFATSEAMFAVSRKPSAQIQTETRREPQLCRGSCSLDGTAGRPLARHPAMPSLAGRAVIRAMDFQDWWSNVYLFRISEFRCHTVARDGVVRSCKSQYPSTYLPAHLRFDY